MALEAFPLPLRSPTLGNYRQHITFASVLGFGYAWLAYALAGVHWMYGSVAVLLSTLAGLLPDLDSPSGVELKGFTGLLGVLGATAAWQALGRIKPPPAFEFHLWGVILTFVVVRHGVRRVATRISVHRGISHSLPVCGIWGALTYLYYPGGSFEVRLVMALSVMLGFVSHLLLDEICSVDLRGARVNRAFGSALKLRAPSPWITLAAYALLGYLAWKVSQDWPPGRFHFIPPPPPFFPARALETLDHRLFHRGF
ncbi:MAG: hypothetical protein NVSMB9_09810 [Isosphaeraceae bacterium]